MNSLLITLLQVLVIIAVARAMGWLFRRLHQPQVIGEMLAGILLGPSLLGLWAPDIYHQLFPESSLSILQSLSQIGLILFMFLVGLEFDPKLLKGQGRVALISSYASIVGPFVLGVMSAIYLYPKFSDDSVSFTQFALFFGACMCVTAFPVLARILSERNIIRTKLGGVALACAAINDVVAWTILVGIVAFVRAAGIHNLLFTFIGTSLYVAAMVFIARPLLLRMESFYFNRGRLTQDMLAIVVLLLLISSLATEFLGIHALFGAFLLGVVMPKDVGFIHDLIHKFEDLVVVLLLPLFFAITGLRTEISLLTQNSFVWDFLMIITVAVVGKFVFTTLAARYSGLGLREASALGILMNTRGLMELVILTIGLDLGVISPIIFTMMVMMAIITTIMTTPLLELIYPSRILNQESKEQKDNKDDYRVMIPVALAASGPELLRLAVSLSKPVNLILYALHLIRANERSLIAFETNNPKSTDLDPLEPLINSAKIINLQVRPLTFVSLDAAKDITDLALAKSADLVLMGWHKPVISQSILSGTVHDVMINAQCDVAVYVPRHTRAFKRILVPYLGKKNDLGALDIAKRMSKHGEIEITLLHVVRDQYSHDPDRVSITNASVELAKENVFLKVIVNDSPEDTLALEAQQNYDLVIIGVLEDYGLKLTMFSPKHERLVKECPTSLLIVHKYLSNADDKDKI